METSWSHPRHLYRWPNPTRKNHHLRKNKHRQRKVLVQVCCNFMIEFSKTFFSNLKSFKKKIWILFQCKKLHLLSMKLLLGFAIKFQWMPIHNHVHAELEEKHMKIVARNFTPAKKHHQAHWMFSSQDTRHLHFVSQSTLSILLILFVQITKKIKSLQWRSYIKKECLILSPL